jgi:hypothetical protein
MELIEHIEPLLDRLAAAEPWLAAAGDRLWQTGARLAAVELPVPDLALVGAFAFAVGATILSHRGRDEKALSTIEELYRAELLTANRRAQQAHDELGRARREIEHERQKRRRAAAASRTRRGTHAEGGRAPDLTAA